MQVAVSKKKKRKIIFLSVGKKASSVFKLSYIPSDVGWWYGNICSQFLCWLILLVGCSVLMWIFLCWKEGIIWLDIDLSLEGSTFSNSTFYNPINGGKNTWETTQLLLEHAKVFWLREKTSNQTSGKESLTTFLQPCSKGMEGRGEKPNLRASFPLTATKTSAFNLSQLLWAAPAVRGTPQAWRQPQLTAHLSCSGRCAFLCISQISLHLLCHQHSPSSWMKHSLSNLEQSWNAKPSPLALNCSWDVLGCSGEAQTYSSLGNVEFKYFSKHKDK